jgi:tetratricopeptide (TPR) repeat protein
MGGRGAAIPISIAPPAASEVEAVRIPRSPSPPKFSVPDFTDGLARVSAAPPEVARASVTPPEEREPSSQKTPTTDFADAERLLEAMTHFRLAEEALQRNDLAEAERLAARAVVNDPTQLDYVALHIWIRAMTSTKNDGFGEAVLALSKLLAEEPKNERALLYRGKLLKKTSRIREALRDFERLLQANPRHHEANQEIRLLKQRVTK